LKILYMGSPQFAIFPLKALLEKDYQIVGVVTQPDKPAKRGRKLMPPPLKEFAEKIGIKVFQPVTLKKSVVGEIFSNLEIDFIVTAAYGKILPQWLLSLPRFMPLNVHPSLLPKYRGAAPINWAIINGDLETGVTIMEMVKELDAGDILLQERVKIREDETAGELSERLSKIGGKLLVEFLKRVERGEKIVKIPQDEESVSYAPQIDRKMAKINWSRSDVEIHNFVRGLNPWPIAETKFRKRVCKIYRTKRSGVNCENRESGEIFIFGKKLHVCCGNGKSLEILELQFPGKRILTGRDFINGFRIKDGERFI